jgi:uncharacterized protein (TIGR02996 family)
MSEALFQAILDAPEDDELRLVYSDWLEDNGQAERAEFIRAQIELTRTPRYDPRFKEPEGRARALLHGGNTEWDAPVRPDWDVEARQFGSSRMYRRGFIESVTFRRATDFTRSAARLFKLAPVLHVEIEVPWFSHATWKRCGAVARLRALKLDRYARRKWDAESLEGVLDHPGLANLTALDVGENYYLGDDWGEVLAGATHLTGLRSLDLAGNGIGIDGLECLAKATFLPSLRTLNLSGNNLGVRGMATLAVMPQFAGLTDLRLGQDDEFDFEYAENNFGDEGVRQLVASPHLARLNVLSLHETGITDAGVRVLAAWPGLASVTYLDLGWNAITAAGVAALAASPYLTNLRGLSLGGINLTIAEVRPLIESPNLTGLIELALVEEMDTSPDLWEVLEDRFGAGLEPCWGDWQPPEPGSDETLLG